MDLEDGKKELLLTDDSVVIVAKATWDHVFPDGLPSIPWRVRVSYHQGEIVQIYRPTI